MATRCCPLIFILALSAFADRLPPLPAAADYPASAVAGSVSLGAQYMGQSVTVQSVSFGVPGYLVVEAGVYPAKDKFTTISAGSFTLRVNGKQTLLAQTPGMVAASLKYSDWEQHRQVVAVAGPVIAGRPEQAPRFPGDRRPPEARAPNLPRVPTSPAPESGPAAEAARPEELVIQWALEEGSTGVPRRGFLYFPWKGKPKSLKSLDLIYQGDNDAKVTLKLL